LTNEPEAGDVPDAVLQLPLAREEEPGEPLAAAHRRVVAKTNRHFAPSPDRAPEDEEIGPVVDHDYGPGGPETPAPDVLHDDHLAAGPHGRKLAAAVAGTAAASKPD